MEGIYEFPANMRELLAAPKTLMIFLAGVATLIYVSTDPMMAYFFAPAILATGMLAYFVFLWHKQGYKLDLIRKVVPACADSMGDSQTSVVNLTGKLLQTRTRRANCPD